MITYEKYLKKEKNKKILIKFIRISIVILFFLIWQLLSSFKIINTFIYSSPLNIIKTIYNLYLSNNLFIHIYTTLNEILISIIISISLSFIISILLYEYHFLYHIIEPFLIMLNSMPKVALGPIIIILCGANTKSIIFIGVLISIVVSTINIYNSLNMTDKLKIKMFDTFGATKLQKLIYLIIPLSFHNIISTLKLNISLTLIGVITGEFLVSKQGIGYLIIYGSQVFNMDLVYAGIFLLIIISYILYKITNLIDRYQIL